MTLGPILTWGGIVVAVGIASLTLFGWLVRFSRTVRVCRAVELYRLQIPRLETLVLRHGHHLKKPVGLIWTGCEFTGAMQLWRGRESSQWFAFVPVRVDFQPDPEGDMVDLPQAKLPRHGVAVLAYETDNWHATDRILLNIEIDDIEKHFGSQFERFAIE